MHDSAGTSGSAASSGGSSSLPGSSGDSPLKPASDAIDAAASEGLRVDFYVLEEASASGRLKLACRLAEKAYLAAQVALVWHTDVEELRTFDEMLWTFMDGSFVPHDIVSSGVGVGAAGSVPVSMPGSVPVSLPGSVHGSLPGSVPGSLPGSVPGSLPGSVPGSLPRLTAAAVVGNEAPVLLSAGIAPPANVDIIINLAPEIPGCLSQARRVAEIIDGDDSRRRAGRARFKAYRDLGIQPASHNIRSDP